VYRKEKTMTQKTRKHKRPTDLPGAIYLNKNRYWWKVQLPGEDKAKSRPLKPVGCRYATTDWLVAVEVARNLYQEHIYTDESPTSLQEIDSIAALAAAYIQFCKGYYLDENKQVKPEVNEIQYSLKPLTELFASLSANEFGPLKLMETRDRMITKDWARTLINRRVGRIKRMFKWAVSRQLVSPMVHHALATVEGLKRGRTTARETAKRRPVAEDRVFAILPYTTHVVATMIELQLLTGMRPGELVAMRPCDIDRTDDAIWHYYPEKHKNAYRNIERIVSIGPRGQELLTPYLLRPAEAYCFSPAESEKQRRQKMAKRRRTPLSCGNRPGSNRTANPQRTAGEKYDSDSYYKAVRHATTAARKVIREAGGDPDKQLPKWTPYQLRHTAATKVRKEMGYECAGATLGHTNMSATAIYAERNQGLADEAAKRFG
jgi:integrase